MINMINQDGRDIERRALSNAIETLAAIAGVVKFAQDEPRKDAWRSIDAIAGILDDVIDGWRTGGRTPLHPETP